MCICTLLKIFLWTWGLGIVVAPLINSFYKGKTGEHLFSDCDEDRKAQYFVWPFYFMWCGAEKALECLAYSYKSLCEWFEQQGKK